MVREDVLAWRSTSWSDQLASPSLDNVQQGTTNLTFLKEN
jgi:hypothetical protein